MSKIKELVAAGHALAKDLHCAESAALVRELATQLEVQFVRSTNMAVQLANAESKCRELAGLVAESADLKSLIEQHACSIAVCPNCSHEEPSETDDIVALYRSLKTPFTDAFLAEVRAQGVERMIEVKQQQLDGMHPDTFAIGAVRDSIRRDIYELKVFAEILRQEAAQ
ncbi:hypothetical protein EOL04_16455 [Citrobacter freundii]|uniref:hypothetical protein n=1 Tax=Citrobacter freundii TaxID=546 RepID=UPI000FD1D88D|nr:hypothetical protein [Citrobacter freundii]RVR27991.1 hypothetical protein EOL29_15440 [Citrobacter freundii]RVR68927.1 hypothetical protein EOL30_10435 [Citrobacter freundii]RVR76476.1 hypothetical protein EOL28_13050 [Citrobacter freundii]RVR81577.1 hypothetical protein EOL32_10820 [Citrobacter freundii]RVS56325.1 hypothetical protein EOL00_17555 [Citrobacter freundii]